MPSTLEKERKSSAFFIEDLLEFMMKRCYNLALLVLSLFVLSLLIAPSATAQSTGMISGTVTDANNGQTLPGANVFIAQTDAGAATDANGAYTIELAPGTYTVRASYVGYEVATRQNVEVEAGETTTVDFQLTPSEAALDEVVVVGYGEQQRGQVTGSVSQVSSADLEDVVAADATSALQGQTSGLMVHRTGVPGEPAEVRVRGLSTLNSNDPLIIVDGVEQDNLVGLNPSDIESIEVLKDASAASIYGSRGAGGVILVTTKSGQPGELRVDFNSSTGVNTIRKKLDLLNTQEYVELNTELRQNAGSTPPARFNQEGFPEEFGNTDWQDALTQNAMVSNVNLAVSGGSQDAQYRASVGYLNQEGVILATGYERYSFRVNSTYDIGRFELSENFSLTHGTDKQLRGDAFEDVFQMPPYIPVRNESNQPGGWGGVDQIDGADKPNPVRSQLHGFNRTNATKISGNVTGEMQIVESLSLQTVFGVYASFAKNRSATPPFFEGDFHNQDFTSIGETETRVFRPTSTTTLNVDDLGFGNHTVNATFGFEIQNTEFKTVNAQGRNPLTDQTDIATLPSATVTANTGTDVLLSGFGRLTYDYAGRYILEASLRRDGYSRFGPGRKWGLFPAASAGWNAHQEPFLEDVLPSSISTLRLRGSWGLTGNKNALNRYEFQPTVNTSGQYNFGGETVVAAGVPQLANASLEWEQTESINVGVEFGVLNDAFTFSADYFQNTTDDILLSVPLPNSFGYSGDTRANTGTVESKGLEFTAGYQSRGSGDFNWSLDANFSTSSNEVTDLGLGNPVNGPSWGWGGSSQTNRIEEGEPIWFWYGWKVDRLFQPDDFDENGNLREGIPDHRPTTSPGDIKFMDLNGDGQIDSRDQTNLGDPHPGYTYGVTARASWKSFDATVFMNGVGDYQLAPAYQGFTRGMTRVWNHESVVLDRWTPNNTDTDVPRAVDGDPNNNSRISDRFVQDADYLRLKRVTIGYAPQILANQFSWLQRARIYVQGEDLLTFTGYEGYDPEVGSSGGLQNFGIDNARITHPRSFKVGVSLNF